MSNLQKPITSCFFFFCLFFSLVKGSIIISQLQVILFSLSSGVPIFYLGLGSGKASLPVILCYLVLHYSHFQAFPVIDCFHLCFKTARWDDLGTEHHFMSLLLYATFALSSIASHSKGSDEEEENGEKKKVPKPADIVNLVSHCTQTGLTV